MTPAELLDDHARRPRNLGKLPAASAIGDVGSIVAGDALRMYLTIDGGRIAQTRFQVFNCQSQVAATSAVAELTVGRDLAAARSLGVRDVCTHLGGLDHTLLPPQLWGLEALRSALDAWESREPVFDAERDALLCRCFGVAADTVRQTIAIAGATTVEAVGAATRAGTGCGSCQADIRRLIEEKDRPMTAAPTATAKPVPGRIATLHRIQRAVDASFLPELRALGCDLELWDFDGRIVRVKVKGRLLDDETLRTRELTKLETLLKAEIDAGIGVGIV